MVCERQSRLALESRLYWEKYPPDITVIVIIIIKTLIRANVFYYDTENTNNTNNITFNIYF